MSSPKAPSATNPVSTGGGGTFFEQHVDALFLALLLVRARFPLLKDCRADEVHLQSEHLGWNTDDCVVVGASGDETRHLLCQVKRHFVISGNDDACKNTFGDFWRDFRSNIFNTSRDRFALITLRGTNSILGHFCSLLDSARAANSATQFANRLQVNGFLSGTARRHAAVIRSILQEIDDSEPSNDDFWQFLRAIHVVSFDLNTSTAQNEAWIKGLLETTANAVDPAAAADSTWWELLELVGHGMPTAASYRHDDLPEALKNRHGSVESRSSQVLHDLTDHSTLTLREIKDTIGSSVVLERSALVNQVLAALNENQVVVLSAPAGLGKSAIAKRCTEILGREMYTLAFRAEEFATAHLDQMLQQAQIPTNGVDLFRVLSGQGRKLCLVDSVERLLEASVRDAFSDFLRLAREDSGLTLLLTCRDYSLETVRSALLAQSNLECRAIEIPTLSDDELEVAAEQLPILTPALGHAQLKRLIRSPYILDKAAGMNWTDSPDLPDNEREFRQRCWREVIQRVAASGGGLPQRRDRVFQEVALRRARQLRPFVSVDDLDPGALEALKDDGLLTSSRQSESMTAPSHDVLEDWAIIQWLEQRWIAHEGVPQSMATDVGGYPALRRAYRKWLTELLHREPKQATEFVLKTFRDTSSLPAYFRDDSLVCALQASSAPDFLEQQRDKLLANDAALLERVIHLMRVACKQPAWSTLEAGHFPTQMLVPSGTAWPSMIDIVSRHIDEILPKHLPIVVGLLEDFSRLAHWRNPEPIGSESAATTAFRVLPHVDDYDNDQNRKKVLKVIATFPRGDPDAFRALVDRATAHDVRRDRIADDAADVLLGDFDSWPACRLAPEQIMRLARSKFLMRLEDLSEVERSWGRPTREIEPHFGIREHLHLESFPPSALRGVFLPLLKHQPRLGTDFVIDLLNHSGAWYGEKRWPYDRLESAFRIEIKLPDNTTMVQWANSRLWLLYRGQSVGPYILQSALMALESWLFELCEIEGVDVDAWLTKILRDSNNVMATAVVASVCNAFPAKARRTALALLSSPEIVRMDRERIVHERTTNAGAGLFPSVGIQKIFEDERKQSSSKEHRQFDMETLALRLQTTEVAEDVFALIDQHRNALPPTDEQSNDDRLWRLALHRMDLRGFRVVDFENEAGEEGEDSRRVQLEPAGLEEDLQELVDQHTPKASQQERDLGLLNWALAIWTQKEDSTSDANDWATFLAHAQSRDPEPEPQSFARGGPGIIAAVCLRDYWDDMSVEDAQWCLDTVVREIYKECDSDDHMVRISRQLNNPDRYGSFALSRVLSKTLTVEQENEVREALAIALTHASEEVKEYAGQGLRQAFDATPKARSFALGAIAAIAENSRYLGERVNEEHLKPFEKQRDIETLSYDLTPIIRTAIVQERWDASEKLGQIDLSNDFEREAAGRIVRILGGSGEESIAVEFFHRVGEFIVEQWDSDKGRRDHRINRDHHFEHSFYKELARRALQSTPDDAITLIDPFVRAVDSHPDEVKDLVQELVTEEDRQEGGSTFWILWQKLADALCAAPWAQELRTRRRSPDDGLVRAIFLNHYWKEDVRHWQRLEGQAHRLDDLARRLRESKGALDSYSRYLYDIGDAALPEAFVVLEEMLPQDYPAMILADSNTVFLLESLLRRYVYSEPQRLKANPDIRAGVLSLLNSLVEAGSSSAYRMRDDFVTPLGIEPH